MFKISIDKLGKASLWACLAGAVVTTVGDVVAKIRHGKREDKLYAKLMVAADTVPTQLLSKLDDKEEEA